MLTGCDHPNSSIYVSISVLHFSLAAVPIGQQTLAPSVPYHDDLAGCWVLKAKDFFPGSFKQHGFTFS